MTKREKIKYLLAPAIGFGIGGALWGWRWSQLFEEAGINNFVFISGAILFGLFGGLFLVVLENIKILRKIFIVLVGLIIWIVVLYMWVVSYDFSVFVFPTGIILFPSLLGIIVGLLYSLALNSILRTKIWPVFWRGLVGFTLASLIGLISASLIENIFSFTLAGIILGLFLGWGVYKGQKLKKIGGRKKKKSPKYEKNLI